MEMPPGWLREAPNPQSGHARFGRVAALFAANRLFQLVTRAVELVGEPRIPATANITHVFFIVFPKD